MHKNIKTAKKYKNTCLLNCNLKNIFTSMVLCVEERTNKEGIKQIYICTMAID